MKKTLFFLLLIPALSHAQGKWIVKRIIYENGKKVAVVSPAEDVQYWVSEHGNKNKKYTFKDVYVWNPKVKEETQEPNL